MQYGSQIAERLELTALYVEEHLFVVVHVKYAVLGEYAQHDAIARYYAGTVGSTV